jgi:hypothetical protein
VYATNSLTISESSAAPLYVFAVSTKAVSMAFWSKYGRALMRSGIFFIFET